MSKHAVPLLAEDISAFARALARQLQEAGGPPGHLGLLNMLARASGFRNYQHLRAARKAAGRLSAGMYEARADHRLVERALNQFDGHGRMVRWPARQAVQDLVLWAFWTRIPAGRSLTEAEVNAVLDAHHLFGDRAILRRSLWAQGFVTRSRDGSDYRRVVRRPPPEARILLGLLAPRWRAAAGAGSAG